MPHSGAAWGASNHHMSRARLRYYVRAAGVNAIVCAGDSNSRPRGYEAQPNPLTYDINAKHLMIAAVVERLCALCAVCARCVTANLQQIVTAPARPGAADRRSAGPSA